MCKVTFLRERRGPTQRICPLCQDHGLRAGEDNWGHVVKSIVKHEKHMELYPEFSEGLLKVSK